jgi:hypothetical protein
MDHSRFLSSYLIKLAVWDTRGQNQVTLSYS